MRTLILVRDEPLTEEDWSDIEKAPSVYEKSKSIAEKTAWDYVKSLPCMYILLHSSASHPNPFIAVYTNRSS